MGLDIIPEERALKEAVRVARAFLFKPDFGDDDGKAAERNWHDRPIESAHKVKYYGGYVHPL